MADETLAGEQGTPDQQGTADVEGQATEVEPTEKGGESKEEVQEKGGEPSGEGLPEGMTPETLLKSYKELQTEFGKRSEAVKGFEEKLQPYGGVEQVEKWANYLANNPRFTEWVQKEQQTNALGMDTSQIDDESRKALETVQKIAEFVVDQKVSQLTKQRIEPLADSYKEKNMDEHFKTMDKNYGNEWRELQEEMAGISETLSEGKQDNPTFEDIEDLYWKAARKSGKFEGKAAQFYEKKLKDKQRKSTERPQPVSGSGTSKKATSMKEAAEQAKKTHGMGF